MLEPRPSVATKAAAAEDHFATRQKSPALYGLGVMAINIILESFGAYAFFFYVEVLGLAMAMAAVVKMLHAVWNSVNDPIFGFWSDNTRSRWGRRHIWLVPSMLLTGLVYVLIFAVPQSLRETSGLFWYMLAILLVFETLTTILIVNYAPLFPEYFHGLKQRSNAAVYYHAGKIFAVLIGLSLTPLVYSAIGFDGMAIAYAVLAVGLLSLALFGNREDPQIQGKSTADFLPALKNVLKDRLFWKFSLAITLVLFGVNVVPLALPFYVRYSLKSAPGLTSLLSGTALIACLLVLPLWGRLMQRWNVRRSFVLAILILSLGMLLLGFRPRIVTALSAMVAIGIAWGGIWVCYNIMRADLVSQNLKNTGKHTEGLYYGLLNVVQNMGGVLQSAAMLLATVWFGYVSGDNPGPQPDMAFRFLMGFAPLTVLAVSWYFVRSFLKDYSEAASA